MKFQRKISPETRKFLLAQLKEFEREVRMTKAERAALHDWVSAGHSPYDNEQNLYFDPVFRRSTRKLPTFTFFSSADVAYYMPCYP